VEQSIVDTFVFVLEPFGDTFGTVENCEKPVPVNVDLTKTKLGPGCQATAVKVVAAFGTVHVNLFLVSVRIEWHFIDEVSTCGKGTMFKVQESFCTTQNEYVVLSPEELIVVTRKYSPHELTKPDLTQVVLEEVKIIESTNDKNSPVVLHFGNELDELVGTTRVGGKPVLAMLGPMGSSLKESPRPLKPILSKDELSAKVSSVVSSLRKPGTPDNASAKRYLVDVTHPAFLALGEAFLDSLLSDDQPPHKTKKETPVSLDSDDEKLQKVTEYHVISQTVMDLSKTGLVLKIDPLLEHADNDKYMVSLTLEIKLGMVESTQNVIRD
jgi:hypothetical protein